MNTVRNPYDSTTNSLDIDMEDGIANQFLNKLKTMNEKVKVYKQVFYNK